MPGQSAVAEDTYMLQHTASATAALSHGCCVGMQCHAAAERLSVHQQVVARCPCQSCSLSPVYLCKKPACVLHSDMRWTLIRHNLQVVPGQEEAFALSIRG